MSRLTSRECLIHITNYIKDQIFEVKYFTAKYQSLKRRMYKVIKGLTYLHHCESLPCHCDPLVECDCRSDRSNDHSGCGRKTTEGGTVCVRVLLAGQ